MGRQAYLAKLAFGRSAFEPTQEIVESDEYIQLESSQTDLPRRYQEFNGNNYIQLYDERGNPINPRSREYGKKLRNAQNDVLAAVGVVERRSSPNKGFAKTYEQRLDELHAEDTMGTILGTTFTLSQGLCTWWIGSIRDRILTLRHTDTAPFAGIVALEYAISGPSIFYAGLMPTMTAAISAWALVYGTSVYCAVLRLPDLTRASSNARRFYRFSKNFLRFGLCLALEAFFYPVYYHAALQRLGLVPALPYLPNWNYLNPFSKSSPLRPFSVHHDASTSIVDFAQAIITAPLVVLCGEKLLKRWVYSLINEAVEAAVISPDNPDIARPSDDDKPRGMTALSLRKRSTSTPRVVRNAVVKLMTALGWATACTPEKLESHHSSQAVPRRRDLAEEHMIDLSVATVTNITPLELATVQTPSLHTTEGVDLDVLPMVDIAGDEPERPTTPPTPLARRRQYDNDPSIRITRREDVIEMENRLGRPHRPHHRVSLLSLEASGKISAILTTHLVGLAVLPLRLVALRLVASHYLFRHGGGADISRVVNGLPQFNELSWRRIGVQVSRLAVGSMLHLAVDLGLWGAHYATCLFFGTEVFGWGTL